MSSLRVAAFLALSALGAVAVVAQDDPSREFFSAYQEYQRAERLEREGRAEDAAAKFRFVATQLGQIRSQSPDWQPLVVEFRLNKTKEAIVRLEGAVDSPTMGPPPDLPGLDGDDDILPPVLPPRREGVAAVPTISISPDTVVEDVVIDDVNEPVPDGDAGRLQMLVKAERDRNQELAAKLQQGEAELTSLSMELEKTRAERIDLAAQLKALQDAGGVPGELGAGLDEQVERLTTMTAELEESLKAAAEEKEELAAKVLASTAQIEELSGELAAARQEAESAQALAAELQEERTQLAAARDEALAETAAVREEVGGLTARVTELEEERDLLVAARDEAQEEAAEAKSALEKSADLIEANRLLEAKLETAAGQIAGMESDAAAKQEVIASLQADLDKVREELASAQTRLQDDRERFDQLQLVNDQLIRQYDEVTGALAAVQLGEVTAAEAKLLQSENEVLRGIIMRQIKEQARREQAFRLAQEEMGRLEIRSDTLNDRIIELAKPTLELTAAEQEMLRRPVITLLDPAATILTAQVEVLRPAVDSAVPAAPENSMDGEQDPPATASGETATADGDWGAAANDAEEGVAESAAGGGSAEEALTDVPPRGEMPSEAMRLLAEARDEFIKGNFAGAEKLYLGFVDLQPDNVVALANLGVSQFRQGKLTAAQLALERAVKVAPEDAFSLTTLGAVMIEQNRIEEAMGHLEKANEVSPDDPIALNYIGVAASQMNQFGKAEQSLRRAITVQPDYAEAHFNLAVIYATAKPPSLGLAKRHYERALELGAAPDQRLATMLQGEPSS
jgi:Flp pilus assembly protein TadD